MVDYDPLSGTPLPVYETTSAPPPGPFTGDSGYSYGTGVLELLQKGVQAYTQVQREKIASTERVELGRQGIARIGQPIATLGGVRVTPLMVLAGLALVAGGVYLATR